MVATEKLVSKAAVFVKEVGLLLDHVSDSSGAI